MKLGHSRLDATGRNAARRLAVVGLISLSFLCFPVAAQAEDAAPSAAEGAGFSVWVNSIGRAIGLAFRDIGQEGKRIGLAIGHAAASFGKEVGQGAATAGKDVGQAAKEGGKAFGRAVTGKGETGAERTSGNNGDSRGDARSTP